MRSALKGLWTPGFFGLRNIRRGMGIILVRWLTVLSALLALWQVDMIAGALFIPYLIWVSIAAALNAAVWRLNPDEAAKATVPSG